MTCTLKSDIGLCRAVSPCVLPSCMLLTPFLLVHCGTAKLLFAAKFCWKFGLIQLNELARFALRKVTLQFVCTKMH